MKKTPLFGGIFSELLIRKQGEIIKKTNITARGNVTEFKYHVYIFKLNHLYGQNDKTTGTTELICCTCPTMSTTF